MLCRKLSATMLALVVCYACEDEQEEDPQERATGTYTFVISGTEGLLAEGKGTIEVQLKRNGQAVTGIEAGIEVTVTVACGTDKTAEFKGTLAEHGRASIAIDLRARGWDVSDWGACTVLATGMVEGKEVKTTAVTVKSIVAVEVVQPNCPHCDHRLPQHAKIGEEITLQDSIGKVSLQGCPQASLYTRRGDDVARVADGVVDAEQGTLSAVYVLGIAGNNCKLRHSNDDRASAAVVAITAAAAGENRAAGYKVGITTNIQSRAISLILPSSTTPASAVYVSGDGGAVWARQNEPKWDGTAFNASVTSTAWHKERVLLRVDADGKSWWHEYGLSLGGNTIGRRFSMDVPTTNTDRQVKLSVADGGSCGLHLFHLSQEGAVKGADYRPRRIPAHGEHIDIEIIGGIAAIDMLAIDGGSASYNRNCKIGLNIDGTTHVARAVTTHTRPEIGRLAITRARNGKISVSLPSWGREHGTKGRAKIKASNDGGKRWTTYANQLTWGTSHVFSRVNWHSGAARNQALLWVEITGRGQGNVRWWYYAAAK